MSPMRQRISALALVLALSVGAAAAELKRLPSMVTVWGYLLMLLPESTPDDLFDGKKYHAADVPTEMSAEAKESMGDVDPRLTPLAPVLGVEAGPFVRKGLFRPRD